MPSAETMQCDLRLNDATLRLRESAIASPRLTICDLLGVSAN